MGRKLTGRPRCRFEAPRKLNGFAQHLRDMRERFERYVFTTSAA